MRLAAAVLCLATWLGTAAGAQETNAELAAWIAAGDDAWEREDHAAARRAYAAVVRADSAHSTRVLFRVGLLNAWRDRFPDALAALRLYVRLEPNDLEGRVALARTYAWANLFPQALAHYDTVFVREPSYRDAVVGRALALAWSDRIPEAERVLEGWLSGNAEDAEAWVQLAQFRRWRGAPHAAQDALHRALALHSDHTEAQRQLAAVRAELRPAALATVVIAKDSEENAFTLVEVAGSYPFRKGLRLTVGSRNRWVSLGPVPPGLRVEIPGVQTTLQWQPPGRAWTFRADVGVVDYPAGLGDGAMQGRAGLRATGRVGTRWRVGGGVGREPFDEVFTTVQRNLMFAVADADAAYAVTPRLSLGLAASRGEVAGLGIRDARATALGAVRWTPRRGTQLALTHREVAWDNPAYGIFFAPQRWTITEASVGWERPAELGVVLSGDLALGSQGVAFEDNALDRSIAPRAAMRLGYRPVPGREIIAALVYANVAGAGTVTASDYRYAGLTLTGRWTF